LYLPDGSAVPWNGLTEVAEKIDLGVSPIYFDGMKVGQTIELGNFSATMKAITYPKEFEAFEGKTDLRNGVTVSEQRPQSFALCYRSMVGNDLEEESYHKIHVLFNVMAIPSDKVYSSISDSPEIVEFEWSLTTVAEEAEGISPTSHIVLDTSRMDPWLLEDVERILYGDPYFDATLMPMSEFVSFLKDWYRVKIVDNGNGTWTAVEARPEFIEIGPDEIFEIINVNAVYLDADTYEISDTDDITDAARVIVHDNGDGTWTMSTTDDNVITVDPDGTFTAVTVDVAFTSPDMYRISSTTTEH
jgi:hypothetical protein